MKQELEEPTDTLGNIWYWVAAVIIVFVVSVFSAIDDYEKETVAEVASHMTESPELHEVHTKAQDENSRK